MPDTLDADGELVDGAVTRLAVLPGRQRQPVIVAPTRGRRRSGVDDDMPLPVPDEIEVSPLVLVRPLRSRRIEAEGVPVAQEDIIEAEGPGRELAGLFRDVDVEPTALLQDGDELRRRRPSSRGCSGRSGRGRGWVHQEGGSRTADGAWRRDEKYGSREGEGSEAEVHPASPPDGGHDSPLRGLFQGRADRPRRPEIGASPSCMWGRAPEVGVSFLGRREC